LKGFERKNIMKNILIAQDKNINDIVDLRVTMQIEDWRVTLARDYSEYAEQFAEITKKHLLDKLGKSIYFAMMYIDEQPVAMCGLEELSELPQITVCSAPNNRHCCVVSVYTKPSYRGKGYQQELIRFLIDFAKKEHFNDITLTTNTPAAAHIYEKVGFKNISNKYFLEQ
jgi:GNAT superfamily N-acetyltransferase